ncbi:MAG TPA: hypothetical protein VF484_02490 [Candidatus Limnocylindrales bacterium]
MVDAVNGQNDQWGVIVQMGYAKQSCYDNCQNGMVNGQLDFWYTAYDGGGTAGHYGEIYNALSWIDFNDDGIHDHPIVGRQYEFTIDYISSSQTWRLTIEDLTTTFTVQRWITRTCDCWFGLVWWGVESYNDASAWGEPASNSDLILDPLQYKTYNGSVFTTVTDQASCSWATYGGATHNSDQSCTMVDAGSGLKAEQLFHP